VLLAKGFYKDKRLATASALSRAAYDKYRGEVHDARPAQLKGLVSQAEFLKTGGKLPAGAMMRPVEVAGLGPSNTQIRLPGLPQAKRR
jgi:hypothetical protein